MTAPLLDTRVDHDFLRETAKAQKRSCSRSQKLPLRPDRGDEELAL